MLLAGTFNALAAANWQRSGGKGQKPKAVTPPKRAKVAGPSSSGAQRAERAGPRVGLASRRMAAAAARGAHAELPAAASDGAAAAPD